MSDNKLTPIMKQYLSMKEENPDAVLMFRLGDFYEVFFSDAIVVSEVLGLVLTHRGKDADGKDIPMCGVPWYASENYFGRLVKAGFNVALVEQTETPLQAKARGAKFIERKIVRVLTSGTLTDDNLLSPKKSNFLASVFNSGYNVFEFAVCDISTGEFFIGNSDNIVDDMIRISPAELIYPDKISENKEILELKEIFKTSSITEKLYQRTDIFDIKKSVFDLELEKSFDNNAVTLLACYLNNTQKDSKISFRYPYRFENKDLLSIDSSTWKSLELDSSLNENSVCLLDILDKTNTAFGARKLRYYIRNLSGNLNVISERQSHIKHIINDKILAKDIKTILSKIPDISRSLNRLLSNRGFPKDLFCISIFLNMLSEIQKLGSRLDKNLSDKFSKINLHSILAEELKSALSDEDIPNYFRDGNFIKSGFNSDLDAVRDLSNGAKNTIAKLQSSYIDLTSVNIKIKYNNFLGYFIEVPISKSDNLLKMSDVFIHRQTISNNMRFTTKELISLDNDIRSATEKSFAIESEIINSFIEKLRNISKDLLNITDLIADLDVWYSLAICAKDNNWICPKISNNNEFFVNGARHPVVEFMLKSKSNIFVKNNCFLDNKKIALITGPNMAGKSTYLRQNALIIILSHLGSFIPADEAVIGLCDQLFSRVGASDNLAAGQSTFMVEMKETANILKRMTEKSFIIFDEIGRGTSTYDGMAIAQSVLEFLNTCKPRTLFATHYHELTHLVKDNMLNNTSCLTIEIEEYKNEIIFLHKIIDGVANKSYGIHVAKMAGIPNNVIDRAEKILESLENNDKSDKNIGEQLLLF